MPNVIREDGIESISLLDSIVFVQIHKGYCKIGGWKHIALAPVTAGKHAKSTI
jgi:hypothetical protein